MNELEFKKLRKLVKARQKRRFRPWGDIEERYYAEVKRRAALQEVKN